MIITCNNCAAEYDAKKNLHQRAAPTVGVGVMDHLLICPNCKAEQHTHYTNVAINRKQIAAKRALDDFRKKRTEAAEQRWRQAQTELQAEFDKLNPRVTA